MPTQKDFKRLVRARMKKTGESYTSARTHLLRTQPKRATRARIPSSPRHLDAVSASREAERAGMSDASVRTRTGRDWKGWVQSLDRLGAMDMPHRRIAALVRDEFGLDGWWSQAVTVGYERIRGLRDIGQRRGGGYEASKTRTIGAPIGALYQAFAEARNRKRWLPETGLAIRASTPDRSIRIRWTDGSLVQVTFAAKGAGRGQVTIQHSGLADRHVRERLKAYWAERLEALAALMGR